MDSAVHKNTPLQLGEVCELVPTELHSVGAQGVLVMDSTSAPPNESRALYWHSWDRSWPRKTIPFAVAPGSNLVLRARFKTAAGGLFQIGLDRYPTSAAPPPAQELAFSDYMVADNDWAVVEVVINAV